VLRFFICGAALVSLILGAASAVAADYTWKPNFGNMTYSTFETPIAACKWAYANPVRAYDSLTVKFLRDGWYTCQYSPPNDPETYEYGAVYRLGDACPPGTATDIVDGQCKAPVNKECEQDWSGGEKVFSEELQQCVKFPNLPPAEFCEFMSGRSTGTQKMEVVSGTDKGPEKVVSPNTFCGVDVTDADCKVGADGTHTCAVSGVFNGEYVENVTEAPKHCASLDCEEVPPEEPIPEPELKKENKPCIYSASGDRQVCTSERTEEQEGKADCGVVNGVATCITHAPSKNGVTIATEVMVQDLLDGNKKTTKKDTATVIKCKGIISKSTCTSTTSTTTTTTVTNGSGQTVSQSGTCVGPACPDKNGNPDADGDGFGDCATGDCGSDEFTAPGAEGSGEEAPSFGDTLGDFQDRLYASPLISAAKGLSFSGSGSCSMGSNFTLFGRSMGFGAVCGWASDWFGPLRTAMLALWALVAVRTFFEA